jgi:hypothetical protein
MALKGDVLCQPQAKILFGEGGGGKGEQPETEVAGWRRYSMLRWRERRTATCGLCKRAACVSGATLLSPCSAACYVALPA